MTSSPAAKREANENAMPLLGAEDISVDMRIGRGQHMAFAKGDPVALSTYIAEQDESFQQAYESAYRRYAAENVSTPLDEPDQGGMDADPDRRRKVS